VKSQFNWSIIPTAIALTLAISASAYSQPVQTPLRSPVVVNGNSGGNQASACGNIAASPSQVVVVNQPTPLRFSVQGQGQITLLINGPNGRTQCVMADNFSNGTIQIPGVWPAGSYSVYVGDRSSGSHLYTLSITQEN
jgi:hypothetical protein